MYNSTALPASVRDFQRLTGMDYNQLLSTNPKTDKNELSTSILHLAPSNLSGFNVCKFAGNCKQICLHFSGNPAFKSKYEARINRTKAFFADKNKFMELLILSILRQYKRNNYNKIGVRLNGTSDILYENIGLNIPDYLANCIYRKYGLSVNSGPYANIFMLFRLNNLEAQFYDYTKKADIVADLKANKDFLESFSYRPINRQDLKELGHKQVLIRYKNLLKVTSINL